MIFQSLGIKYLERQKQTTVQFSITVVIVGLRCAASALPLATDSNNISSSITIAEYLRP